jgi:hypothetical protein
MPTPDITVNPGSGDNFNPTPYPKTGKVSTEAAITFQAGSGNTAINFYVFEGTTQSTVLFGGTQPYSAAAPSSPTPTSYTVQPGAANKTFTLSLNSSVNEMTGTNGQINVGT